MFFVHSYKSRHILKLRINISFQICRATMQGFIKLYPLPAAIDGLILSIGESFVPVVTKAWPNNEVPYTLFIPIQN
ncbi:hypothetical protein A7P95_04915 [Eikenella longinqua]|uniref:Uncharacterized protein n=1 Tax=Eikenella longinqua TaxID=1795827 RepID=A0A1A9RY80_9NEIS|nr:hypothetical protein A7P95_04915 [Eikenella longinqua]